MPRKKTASPCSDDIEGIDVSALIAELDASTEPQPEGPDDIGDRILIRVLAASDAARLPIRDWSSRYLPTNRYFALRGLAGSGIPFRANAVTNAIRTNTERELARLSDAGMVLVTRQAGRKYPLVKLTPIAEARARALCGLSSIDHGRMLLDDVAEESRREPRTLDELWVDEIALNEGRGWDGPDTAGEDLKELARIQSEYVAQHAAGWLTCGSTIHGHVRYAVTATGWDEVGSRAHWESQEPNRPSPRPEMLDLYRHALQVELTVLTNATPSTPGELGELPLPVAHEEVEIY